MNVKWLKGYEDREARKAEVLKYKRTLAEAVEVLRDEFEESTPDYTNSAWPYKQADVNGANRKLQEIIDFLTIEDN